MLIELFKVMSDAIENENRIRFLVQRGARDGGAMNEAEEEAREALKQFNDCVRADPLDAMERARASGDDALLTEVEYVMHYGHDCV